MLPLLYLVHLSGPICVDVQLVESIRHDAIRQRRIWGSIEYFWRQASTWGDLHVPTSGCGMIGEPLLQRLRVLSLRSQPAASTTANWHASVMRWMEGNSIHVVSRKHREVISRAGGHGVKLRPERRAGPLAGENLLPRPL